MGQKPLKGRVDGFRRMTTVEFDDAILDHLLDSNPKTEEKLLRVFWNVAWRISKAYAIRLRLPHDDLFSVALIGALDGIRSYKGEDFLDNYNISSYIRNGIRWRILRESVQMGHRVKVPLSGQGKYGEIFSKLSRVMDEYGLGHPLLSNGVQKLADHFGVSTKVIETVYLAKQTRDTTQETPARAASMGIEATLEDKLECEWPSPESFAERWTIRRNVTRALSFLTPREERVIRLRFGFGCDEHTFEEVGDMLGTAKERPRQIEAKALRKLKHPSRLHWLVGWKAARNHEYGDGIEALHLPYQNA